MKNGIYEHRGLGHQALVRVIHVSDGVVVSAHSYQVEGEYRDSGGWRREVLCRRVEALDLSGFQLVREMPTMDEVLADIESRLTREDCDAWHAGEGPTANVEALVDQYGPFQVWGTVAPGDMEEPLRVIWPT